MKRWTLSVALAAACGIALPAAHAESFTYHGSLQEAGQAANGRYDMQLTLYSAREGGRIVAGPVTVFGVPVTEGSFATEVDFGAAAPLASTGWVDVQVKPAGETAFTALDGRSSVAPDGTCPGSWNVDGNAGLTTNNYLGTADNTRVYIKSNNITSAFFDNGSVGLAFPDGVAGQHSTAIGYHAHTTHDGSIVMAGFSDNGFSQTLTDSTANQFVMAAAGGVGINTSLAGDGQPLRDELTIAPSPLLPASNADLTLQTGQSGYTGFNIGAEPGGYFVINGLYNNAGVLDYSAIMRFNYSFSSHTGYVALNGSTYNGPLTVGDAGGGKGNGAYVTGGGVWTNASSRTFKDGFGKVDVGAVLDKLVSLPVQTWFYKSSRDEGQHMGPFAEDFAKMFGLGNDEKHITTVDESGVTIAAIQGLNEKVETENAALKQENAALRDRLDRVVARLDDLESRKEK